MSRRMSLRKKVAESFFLTDTETAAGDEPESSCGTSEAPAQWLSMPKYLSRNVGSVEIYITFLCSLIFLSAWFVSISPFVTFHQELSDSVLTPNLYIYVYTLFT